jgi:hypothetical protein
LVAVGGEGFRPLLKTVEATHRTTIEDLVMAAMRVEEDRKAAGDLPN